MRRALVTGASGSIGASICHALAAAGHHVIVHAHRQVDAAREVAKAISARGGQAEVVAFDVTDRAGCAAALERVLAVAPVQILVNNAGYHDDAPLAGGGDS